MYFEERKNKAGKIFYVANERYVDPLTGKKKRASVVYHSNTVRARRQAERELIDKIDSIISKKQGVFKSSTLLTFDDLKRNWFETPNCKMKLATSGKKFSH